MAIRFPTQLVINISSKLNVDKGNGVVNKIEMVNETWNLPFSNYSVGSVDIEAGNSLVLGPMTSGIFMCEDVLNFKLDSIADGIDTKLFSYSGASDGLTVTNSSLGDITLEYMLGTV